MSGCADRAGSAPPAPNSGRRLRLLSYNIQTGIETRYYHHYITRGWRHLLPDAQRLGNLDRIGDVIADFDLVGLQELDAGSLRSGFINQAAYLAQRGGFPHWYSQTNRRIGRLARHSKGLLSRVAATEITDMRLPGRIPGRGVLMARFGEGESALTVLILHMALGRRARERQFAFVAELVNRLRHVIVMGDLNCRSESAELARLQAATALREPLHHLHTYPSWRPNRNIDHILVSESVTVRDAAVLDYPLSDHLPITMEVELPGDVHLPE